MSTVDVQVQKESGQLAGGNPLQTTKQASHTSLSEIFIPKMETAEGWGSVEGKHHARRPCFNSSVPGAHPRTLGYLIPWLKPVTDLPLFHRQMDIRTLSIVTGKLIYFMACYLKTDTVTIHFLFLEDSFVLPLATCLEDKKNNLSRKGNPFINLMF